MKRDLKRQKQWNYEYTTLKGIQLDFNQAIPEVIKLYNTLLHQSQQTVLDLGCGKGRISLHLALTGHNIIGIDFISRALDEFSRNAALLHLEDHIRLIEQDLTTPWKVEDHSIDTIFAITFLDNIITTLQMRHVLQEIKRVLKPGGFICLEYYTHQDGYYGDLLARSEHQDKHILTDQHNHITFKIHTKDEITAFFGPAFEVIKEKVYSFTSYKYWQCYQRNSHILIMQQIV